jgi:ribose transport system substrate-binding protein
MKKFFVINLALLVAFGLAGCGNSESSSEPTEPTKSIEKDTYEIEVIVKGMDSDYWQTVLQGAEKAAEDSNGKINVTLSGPPSETDIDQQLSIIENAISKSPDGIVMASTSSDAPVPAIERAMNQGIPVVLVDTRMKTDNFVSFIATDNKKAGALAADAFVEGLQKQGKDLKGEVGIISAVAGLEVLNDRNNGFIDRLKEIAPEIKPLEIRYVEADTLKAVGATEDILTTNPEVLGFFADTNITGNGIARAVQERGLEGELTVVSFDADEVQIRSLQSGGIYALIVQDPFGMGYKGVQSVVNHIEGNQIEKELDTGATAVTKENFENEEVQELLFPNK